MSRVRVVVIVVVGEDLHTDSHCFSAGCDVNHVRLGNVRPYLKGTALKMAAHRGCVEVVRVLLEAGANPNLTGTTQPHRYISIPNPYPTGTSQYPSPTPQAHLNTQPLPHISIPNLRDTSQYPTPASQVPHNTKPQPLCPHLLKLGPVLSVRANQKQPEAV